MALSDKSVQEFKEIFEKDYGKKLTDQEAREYSERLYGVMKILFDIAVREEKRKRRLKDYPDGYSLDPNEGIYSCLICHKSISGDDTWWDENGLRCKDCQRNIKDGVIPIEICKNKDIWFKDWQLKSDLGVHPMTAKKMRREGLLKGRELKDINSKTYFMVYLVEENKEFLKKVKWKDKGRTEPLFNDSEGTHVF